LIWKERRGFAKVAIDAKTVIENQSKVEVGFFFILSRQSFQCLQKTFEKLFVL